MSWNSGGRVPPPRNEPNFAYSTGSPERTALKRELEKVAGEKAEIPLLIGAERRKGTRTAQAVMPHDHAHVLADFQEAGPAEVTLAIEAAERARPAWESMPFVERAAIFLRAAELLAGPWRQKINAATMLGQSKTAHQAEIDAAAESIDFLRFNVAFAEELYAEQPLSSPGVWNRTEYRALDGFVAAIAPFNFTAIALNLCTAPAILGNTVVLKPASTSVLSGYRLMELLQAAGLPPGVINFVPGPGAAVGDTLLAHPKLAGLHFTGSTKTFNSMWRTIGANVDRYTQYPRVVGETGGKDFVFVHASAADELDAIAVAVVRAGYEYQGQKCSACSRIFVPRSLWPGLRDRITALIAQIRMGDVRDFRNFMGAVIDRRSFDGVSRYLERARAGQGCRVLAGGNGDAQKGFFLEPTFVECESPTHELMTDELFAPVVAAWVYDDDRYEEALAACDQAASYALTGAIFARDRAAILAAHRGLRHAAGNFYVNDKPTGAVVGQQPFGGGRGSGTNDKAGSKLNLTRWVSARTIKETFVAPTTLRYPFQDDV